MRQAVLDDLDAAVQVITEVSAWLADKDIPWLIDFPGPFRKRIGQGEVYLAYLNDWKTLVGTVSLSREPDPELWGSYPGQARYVHRLAVRRKFAGQGIGIALLDLAGNIAAKERVPWLRLDCSKDNKALQSYYLNQGFEHLDTVDLPHRLSGALFQRYSRLLPQIKEVSNGTFTISLLQVENLVSIQVIPLVGVERAGQMDPVTIGAVVLAIVSGAAGEAGSKLWDGLNALVRRPLRNRSGAADPMPSAVAELVALEQGPADEKRAAALGEALLARAGADRDFGRELENWWTNASQVVISKDSVTNTISGGTQYGPVLQGRDFSNINFGAPPATASPPPSQNQDS